MAQRVMQIDLERPIAPIPVPRNYGGTWFLIRMGRQPLGWVRCRHSAVGSVITPDVIQGLIADFVGLSLHETLRRGHHIPPPQRHTPSASVVVCTREHPDQLERQLKSLEKLDYPDFEVIVVDNCPRTEGTRLVCERFPFVRYLVEPRKGLDYARNAGWRAARGEIVAYTDDDAAVDPGWLGAICHNYADPSVACVTGITFPMELETEAQGYFEKYGGMQRGFVRRVYRPGTWSKYYPLGSGRFGAGVNLSLRRSMLEQLGGFDNALDVGSLSRGAGDLDIMVRAIQAGGCLVYEPTAIVWHQHRQNMAQLRRQMFDYGFGFCAYLCKHAQDLEWGNQSVSLLKYWSNKWGRKRLAENVKLALRLRPHFPIHLILLEILGGVLGLRAYPRAVRRVQSTALRTQRDGVWAGASKAALVGAGIVAPNRTRASTTAKGRAA